MPRAFTLQRLMLAITVFCIVCGLSAAFPAIAVLAWIIAPAAFVWIVLAAFSHRPWELLSTCAIGAFIGLFYLLLFSTGPPAGVSEWQEHFYILIPPALSSFLGALLLGGAALFDDILTRRQRP